MSSDDVAQVTHVGSSSVTTEGHGVDAAISHLEPLVYERVNY
jgi:hypothetical protein